MIAASGQWAQGMLTVVISPNKFAIYHNLDMLYHSNKSKGVKKRLF